MKFEPEACGKPASCLEVIMLDGRCATCNAQRRPVTTADANPKPFTAWRRRKAIVPVSHLLGQKGYEFLAEKAKQSDDIVAELEAAVARKDYKNRKNITRSYSSLAGRVRAALRLSQPEMAQLMGNKEINMAHLERRKHDVYSGLVLANFYEELDTTRAEIVLLLAELDARIARHRSTNKPQ